MRRTIVPAQITTVEDKIAGNLNLIQLILLLSPVFVGSSMYISFPPLMHIVVYKGVLIVISIFIAGSLAFRIKNRIVLHWLILIFRYNLRPAFYVANKNDQYYRHVFEEETITQGVVKKSVVIHPLQENTSNLSIAESIQLEWIIQNPKSNTRFIFSKKGGLYASLSKI